MKRFDFLGLPTWRELTRVERERALAAFRDTLADDDRCRECRRTVTAHGIEFTDGGEMTIHCMAGTTGKR